MADPITILCLFHGDTSDQHCGVTIDRSQYCRDLKDAIKAKNPNSDPRQFQLWKVNIPIGEDDDVPEMEEPSRISMGKKISDYFGTESFPDTISIMVKNLGKYNSFRFNHAYLLTVLSSLKLLHLVSETRVSFFNYAYLLTVLSSLKLLHLVSETRVSFSNYAYLLTVLLSLKLLLLVSETRISFSNYASFLPTMILR